MQAPCTRTRKSPGRRASPSCHLQRSACPAPGWGGPPSAAIAATATPGASLHVDVAHSGNASGTGFPLPVERAWSRRWHGKVSYPVIGDGKVFVAVSGLFDSPTRKVFALDATTGQTVWKVLATGGDAS